MSETPPKRLRARLYAWGRETLPVRWRRAVRRRLSVERLFGVEKPVPQARLRAVSAEQMTPHGPDVLFLPVISWFYSWQRPQQLASALARRGRRVFYGTLGGPGEPSGAAVTEGGVILLAIDGVGWEDPPDRPLRGRPLRLAEEAFVRHRERFGINSAALVAETPYWEPLLVRLRERFGWQIVFDCLDDYAAFSSNRASVLRRAEDRLAVSADLVVATSRPLVEKLSRRSRNSHLLPNACDYELFSRVPGGRPTQEGLRIGYFGALEDWFDTELLAELADRRPDWIFDLVGEPEPEVRAVLADRKNVLLRGEWPHAALPSFLESCDVVVIPLRVTPLTDAVDPVKFYEAAASGRPIVATPMAQLHPYAARGLVRLAATAAEFEREITAAAAEAEQTAPRLRAFARENTWDIRARDLEGLLSGLFSRSRE